MFSGYPLPNPPFFSFSSVPTFLAQADPHDRLGKHSLRECHDPDRPEVSAQKRPRILSSVRGNADSIQDGPWHHNDPFVRKFNQEELQSIVEPKGDQTIVEDTCPVHPLLHPLLGITSTVPGIAHALRLATRFLSSRHTLTFFHNLLTAQLKPLIPESLHYGMLLSHLDLPKYTTMMTGLTDDEKNLTMHIMVALKPHISIQIMPDQRLDTKWAYTERVTSPKYTTHPAYYIIPKLWPTPAASPNLLLRQLNFTGTDAAINLSHCFLDMLHPDNHTPTPAQRLRAAYMLAITLIHELAHAMYMCRFASLPLGILPPGISLPPNFDNTEEYEPFFAAQRKAELGHALETCLFGGGKILSLAQDPEFGIGLGWQRWPDVEDYGVKDAKGWTVALQRLGATAPKWETIYAVSHEWIRQQFEKTFWDQVEVEGLGGGLLRVSKDLGSRCKNNHFFTEADGSESNVSSRDRGWDADGVVRPGQEFVESEPENVSDDEHEDNEDE